MGAGRKGGVTVLCMRYFLVARLDERFVVHDVHCPRKGEVAVWPRGCKYRTVDGDRTTRSRCVGGAEM